MPLEDECIALATDEGYVAQACIVLASYALSNPLNRRDTFVFTNNVSEGGIRMLRTTAAAFGLKLTFQEMDGSLIREFSRHTKNMIPHVSEASYGKILIPRSLPETYKRCLILDCDILVKGSLDRLFETDLQGRSLGAAIDAMEPTKSATRLGLSKKAFYFNSGVLLVDLKQWNLEKPLSRAFDLIAKNHRKMMFMEQDLLNLLFNGQLQQLDSTWNAIMVIVPRGYVRNWKGVPEDQAILHFAGELKPWHEFYHPAVRNIYLEYSKLCSWIKIPCLGPSGEVQTKCAVMLAKQFGLQALIEKYTREKDDA
jgi:lipopolysaccharide biosynthesis glycosyltransferase